MLFCPGQLQSAIKDCTLTPVSLKPQLTVTLTTAVRRNRPEKKCIVIMVVFTWEKSGGFGAGNLKNYNNPSKLVLPKIAFT